MPRSLYEKIERLFDKGILDTTYPPSVYEAYLKASEVDLDELKHYPTMIALKIESSYIGFFESRRDFVDWAIEFADLPAFPEWLTVDVEATWDRGLQHMYDFVQADGVHEDSGEGWYFSKA